MPHPFADIGTCILRELGAEGAITVRSFSGGAWDSTGRYAGSITTEILTTAVVNPSTSKEIEKLPENERTKEAITVFTRSALQTSDVNSQGKADQILWKGREYEVQIVGDWTTQAQYSFAIGTRIGV